ncbi:Cadmium, cobalt and zinc/H(+)-K(+) antiporter [anaerobic digester metagenome]
MEHEHRHRGGSVRMLTYALVITAAFALVEVIGGVLSGSLALLSDAGHMFTDVLALGLSLGASLVASRQATERHTFGFLRAEILVALVNGIALVGISLLVVHEALGRLSDPTPVDADLMLIVAVVGMAANLLGMTLLHRGSKENLNVRGAFLHMMGDLLSSFGVIAAALLIRFLGWQEADALIGLAIAAVIMVGAYRLISQSVSILLEAVPKHIQLKEVEEAMTSVEGVMMVHDLHVWTLSSGIYALSGHVVVGDQQVSACSPVLRELERMLEERFHIGHVTIQIETGTCPANGCTINCRNGGHHD